MSKNANELLCMSPSSFCPFRTGDKAGLTDNPERAIYESADIELAYLNYEGYL